jgi:ribosomal-protein-serine acetyltransferase
MQRPREVLTEPPVTLRRWRASEPAAAALPRVVAGSIEHLQPWMPWAVAGYGQAETGEFLQACELNWESGEAFNYAIMNGGELAGSCGLMARIGSDGLEIGYWVAAGQARRGLATAATAALTREAFTLPGIDRVEIKHDERNVASGGVPRKLGFTEAGREPGPPELTMPDGGPITDVVWRITRAQWLDGLKAVASKAVARPAGRRR